MSTDTHRKTPSLREAPSANDDRRRTVVRACSAVALIAAAVALIAWSAIVVPEQPEASYTTAPFGGAVTEPVTSGWPAPQVDDTFASKTGNVQDLTF